MKEFNSVVGNEQFSPSMNFKKCSEVGMLWVNQSALQGTDLTTLVSNLTTTKY